MIELRSPAARTQAAALVGAIAYPSRGARSLLTAPPTRRCESCRCRLSRYARQTETLCAPCQRGTSW